MDSRYIIHNGIFYERTTRRACVGDLIIGKYHDEVVEVERISKYAAHTARHCETIAGYAHGWYYTLDPVAVQATNDVLAVLANLARRTASLERKVAELSCE